MTGIESSSSAPLPKRGLDLFVAALWAIAVIAATLQQGVQHQNNNFLIFRAASLHLLHGLDLYAAYPALHVDFYKYSPTFALLFLPFAVLPFAFSMLAWNALNAGVLWMAIALVLPRRGALIARSIVFLDMLGSLQNVQSNALVAGLIILTFAAYERRHTVLGTVAAGFGTSIKVFPLAGLSFAVFHPGKLRVAAVTVVVTTGLLLAPLLVTPVHTLLAQYASWRAIESHDALDRGFTVMQMVQLLFRQDWPNWPQQLAGVVLLVAPVLVQRDQWANWSFRRLYLCSVLLFCVIFNHQSESPTFVIAVAGAAIWFATLDRPTRAEWGFFVFVVVCTILASSDAMPRSIQHAVFDRYHFKTVPCIVLWVVIQVRLWSGRRQAFEV
ncbi:glycosyltransferase family 87 protein [soil metagenome]